MFSADFNTLTFSDVQAFCQERMKEGVRLDYKREIPKNLAKELAAFANTHGGLIVIGVDEDDQSRPRLPIEGMAIEPKLEERVRSIALQGIYPPVFPDVAVVEVPVTEGGPASRCIIVIRVHESEDAPHAIENRTQVYLRIDNQSQPYPLATIDQIAWLQNRRNRAVELRRRLVASADERSAYLSSNVHLHPNPSPGAEGTTFPIRFSMVPLFPHVPLASPSETLSIGALRDADILWGPTSRVWEEFPVVGSMLRRIGGGAAGWNFRGGRASYAEFNQYGLFYTLINLFGRPVEAAKGTIDSFEAPIGPGVVVEVHQVLAALSAAIVKGLHFTSKLGFRGVLEIKLELLDARGSTLIWGPPSVFGVGPQCLDQQIVITRQATFDDLLKNRMEIVRGIMEEVLWAYDTAPSEESWERFSDYLVAILTRTLGPLPAGD